MDLIACISLYFKCFFDHITKKQSSYALAFEGLIQSHSYRLSSAAHKDYLIGLRYFKKALNLIWSNQENILVWESNSKKAVFDGAIESATERQSYLENIRKEKIKLFISKEDLGLKTSLIQKLVESFSVSIFASVLIPISFFHPNRGSIALNMLEMVECARLMQHLERFSIDYLYFFCGFNKDSNFIALRLAEKQIYSHKIPSSNPIKNFYQKVISDHFSFTAPFQRREYDALKENWMVKEFSDWPVFRFQTIQPLLKSYSVPAANSLGFISSGIWRRIERGDLALGVGELDAELKLIDFLKVYLQAYPEIKFSIFLHPIEKSTAELFEKAKSHYNTIFEGTEVGYYSPSEPSFKLFDQVDVSIAAYSSTNLERLYAGFKTLYAPLGISRDYYAGSEIENIAAFDEDHLEILLRESISMSNSEFFKKYDLEAYHNNFYKNLFSPTN